MLSATGNWNFRTAPPVVRKEKPLPCPPKVKLVVALPQRRGELLSEQQVAVRCIAPLAGLDGLIIYSGRGKYIRSECRGSGKRLAEYHHGAVRPRVSVSVEVSIRKPGSGTPRASPETPGEISGLNRSGPV